MKVKGITGKNIFIHAPDCLLELVVLMKFVLSQNPITQRKFIIEWVRTFFLKSKFIVDTLSDKVTNYIDYTYSVKSLCIYLLNSIRSMNSEKDYIVSGRLIPRWLNWFPRKAYPEEVRLLEKHSNTPHTRRR